MRNRCGSYPAASTSASPTACQFVNPANIGFPDKSIARDRTLLTCSDCPGGAIAPASTSMSYSAPPIYAALLTSAYPPAPDIVTPI
jgi:hypothetical protein